MFQSSWWLRFTLTILLCTSSLGVCRAAELSVLFLGDQGHHQPRKLFESLEPALAPQGIQLTYTEDLQQLSLENLSKYHGLLLYANIDVLPAEQEQALLKYVAQGGGFIPVHCASFCFRNSAAFVDLVGAQFQKHGAETFTTEVVAPEHPLMSGFTGFTSWDETYIHTRHNDRNRIVLEVRKMGGQAPGQTAEPWTWIRTQGKGRVFYTAWGHDARTWEHPGFINLMQRGIRWACGLDPSVVAAYSQAGRFVVPRMTELQTEVAPFEYEEVGPKIPNYLAGDRWGIQGEIQTKMQKPLPPTEAIKHYVTPENFHLELFVSEAELQGKPIAMNWDERGRLWVCETVDYPNELQPAGQGRDRIRICEDTDLDGRADKFTVFAENLSIPTALEFCRGGVIVQVGEETLFLRDNDGDGRADQREVLISGWALGDTHGGVSNFQYGLDNFYWAMQGYNASRPKYAGGEHPGFRMGPFRFATNRDVAQPTVTDVEFIRSTTNNSWGLGTSEEGLVFASTANRAPSFFVPIPNRYYERVRGWTPSLLADAIAPDHLFNPITDKVRQVDHHGGYTAGAGHALYTARTYPRSWWNRVAFVCGPTGHLVGTYVLNRQGASYRSSNEFNLIASDDEWAAPIMAEVGPDGNVWIIDWYNYIVQHNPTPQGFQTGKGNAYESDLRDKKHGRIYRLVYDGDEGEENASQAPVLDTTRPESLVAALGHTNRLWRRHAQRLLVERGQTDLFPQLIQLLQDTRVDETGDNAAVTHALWTLHGLQTVAGNSPQQPSMAPITPQLRAQLLSHPAPGVRRNALLTLPTTAAAVEWIEQAGSLRDTDAQVQLAALMALADLPADTRGGKLLAELAQRPELMQDRYLKEGLICAAATHAHPYLVAFLVASALQDTTQNQPVRGTPSAESLEVAQVIAEHAARSGLTTEQLDELLNSLTTAPPPAVSAIAEGMARGWPRTGASPLPSQAETVLEGLLERAEGSQLAALLRLGGAWGSEKLVKYSKQLADALIAKIADSELDNRARVSAANELIRLVGQTPESVTALVDALTPQMPTAVASGIVRSLTAATASNVGSELLAVWPSLTPSLRSDALVVLLNRPTTTAELLDAVAAGTVDFAELTLDQRRTLENHPDQRIRTTARRLASSAGVTVNADREAVVQNYLPATHATGNVPQGKLLFTKNCANCHKHFGEGQEVGPDLTGMAVHPKHELLIHILDPNRSVEGNFRRYTLLTADGQVLTGMLAAESQSAIELIDAEGKRNSISREEIDQLTSTNLSLMPAGFEQQMSVAQMGDLLEFLTSKGRFVPLSLGAVASAVSTKGLFSDGDRGPDRMVFDDWSPKQFAGVPFQLIDPRGSQRANIVLLYGPQGTLPPKMPRQVSLPCNMVVKQLHLLSGVSGWGYPASREQSTSLIVRLNYEDGQSEEHPLLNGLHFADYIRRIDVPHSQFAFALGGQQLRFLSIEPKRQVPIKTIELIKGEDRSAPIVMAITAERFE
jgi:putative membrane-bound dehydrogenase-like protein